MLEGYKVISILFLVFLLQACNPVNTNHTSTKQNRYIDSLVRYKMFFTARDFIQKHKATFSDFESLKSQALIDHAFNKSSRAILGLETLLNKYNLEIPDSTKVNLLNILQMNYGKQGEYKKAYTTTTSILSKYTSHLADSERENYENMNKIWSSLLNQSPPSVLVSGGLHIKMQRDKLGLQNLPVTKGKDKLDFIFDTGANLSTITETLAKKWNFYISDTVIHVTSITGNKVNAHIGVCDRLLIGTIIATNLVFLVFPDSALYIEQVPYQINGILGFPLLNALGEIQITRQDDFIVPLQHTKSDIHNMALDFLNPVMELDGESYTFDTGADETALYSPYYKKYKNQMDANYTMQDLIITGVGGGEKKKGFVINFETTVHKKKIKLDSVDLYTEDIKAGGEYYFGNIGQDFISQHDTMILNFKEMFMQFK